MLLRAPSMTLLNGMRIRNAVTAGRMRQTNLTALIALILICLLRLSIEGVHGQTAPPANPFPGQTFSLQCRIANLKITFNISLTTPTDNVNIMLGTATDNVGRSYNVYMDDIGITLEELPRRIPWKEDHDRLVSYHIDRSTREIISDQSREFCFCSWTQQV